MGKNSGKLVGYVIGSSRGDIVCHVSRAEGFEAVAYSFDPNHALRFRRFLDAKRLCEAISHPSKPEVDVLPMYDLGRQWGIEWPSEWSISGTVPGLTFG